MTDHEKKSEWIEKNLRKPQKFKGLRPKYVIIDEILRMPDQDLPLNKLREEFYSHQLPTGYVPPFPTGVGEERLVKENQTHGNFEIMSDHPLPLPQHIFAWREGLRRGMVAEIPDNEAGDIEPHTPADIYQKLNEVMGPEPLGGDKIDDDS